MHDKSKSDKQRTDQPHAKLCTHVHLKMQSNYQLPETEILSSLLPFFARLPESCYEAVNMLLLPPVNMHWLPIQRFPHQDHHIVDDDDDYDDYDDDDDDDYDNDDDEKQGGNDEVGVREL